MQDHTLRHVQDMRSDIRALLWMSNWLNTDTVAFIHADSKRFYYFSPRLIHAFSKYMCSSEFPSTDTPAVVVCQISPRCLCASTAAQCYSNLSLRPCLSDVASTTWKRHFVHDSHLTSHKQSCVLLSAAHTVAFVPIHHQQNVGQFFWGRKFHWHIAFCCQLL